MILVPPKYGNLEVRHTVSAHLLARYAEEVTQKALNSLNRIFRDKFFCDVPSDWVSVTTEEGERGTDSRVVVARATAPRSARVALINPTGEVRTFQVPASTGSRVPVVLKPWQEDFYPRPEHYLVFKGWDAETGLMLFDREGVQL